MRLGEMIMCLPTMGPPSFGGICRVATLVANEVLHHRKDMLIQDIWNANVMITMQVCDGMVALPLLDAVIEAA